MTSGGRRGQGPGHDELLTRLYQQFISEQSGHFGRDYELAAGNDQLEARLGHNVTGDRSGCGASPQVAAASVPANADDASHIGVAPSRDESPADADHMVTALYGTHYRSLVGLAAMLVPDKTTAEELVQDSFVAMHAAWPYLSGNDGALPFLYHAVITRCGEVIRRGDVSDRPALASAPGMPAGVAEILRALPPRQRVVLMLRFCDDFSESQIASAMGTSKTAVRSLTARAMSAMRSGLRQPGN
jgi:DNA-directed RNA polymerase specialized sigma24 family protein